ncbi:MAG: hypothetical protein ACRD9Q_08260 [Nitrososphaeraceae archaeon]
MLSSLHNPKSRRYVVYYSTVLVVVFATGILRTIGIMYMSPIEFASLHFEGFMSMFMLVRNERVGNAFLAHLSKLHIVRGHVI